MPRANPAAATIAVAKGAGYFFPFIAGIVTEPMAAAPCG